ncbi:MAG TPA: hypothetical protein VFZ58_03350 [Candidatus Saccharimonadales bacterium]
MSAADILVVILSTALAILLILSIILMVLLIRITKQIQAITNSARNVMQGVERLTSNLSTFVAPATLLSLVKKAIHAMKQKERRRHDEE